MADTQGALHSSQSLQNYVNSFFGSVGGSPWAGVQTQYCRNVLAGTTSCAGVLGADFVTNPTHQLKGVWTDPTPVPSDIVTLGLAENLVDDPIAAEAMRASAHFKYDPNATCHEYGEAVTDPDNSFSNQDGWNDAQTSEN